MLILHDQKLHYQFLLYQVMVNIWFFVSIFNNKKVINKLKICI